MFGYDTFYDPSEMMLRFHRPNRRFVCLLPTELAAGWTSRKEESESETEENYNDECTACRQRKQKILEKEKTKGAKKEKGNLSNEVSQTSDSQSEYNIQIGTEEKDDDQKFELRLNVNGFEPENIQVKIKDKWLEVSAQSEEKDASSGLHTFRRLHRKYALPEHVNPDHVTSFLNKDGFLSIEAHRQIHNEASLQDKAAVPTQEKQETDDKRVDPETSTTELEQNVTKINENENNTSEQRPAP